MVASISNATVTPTIREVMAARTQPCEAIPIPSEPYYAPDDIWLLRGFSYLNEIPAEVPNDCI